MRVGLGAVGRRERNERKRMYVDHHQEEIKLKEYIIIRQITRNIVIKRKDV